MQLYTFTNYLQMLLIEAALCYNKAPLYCGVSIIANYSECFLGSGISAGSHSNCQFPQLIQGLLYVRNELLNLFPSSNSASSILTPRSNQSFSCHKVNIGNNSRSTNVSSSCHRLTAIHWRKYTAEAQTYKSQQYLLRMFARKVAFCASLHVHSRGQAHEV